MVAVPVHAELDALVREATAQLQAGQADAAYAMLAPHAAERIGDPDFDYALGVAALDTGRYGEAVIALQRVLSVRPNDAPARAELARAYALAGDVDTARNQFDTVVNDPSLPDPVRRRFDGIVADLDRQISGGGSNVTGFIDVSAGHDSNVNSATDLTSIVIPLFAGLGAGTLGAGARAQDDQYIQAQAGVSGVTAIGRQDRLFASALGSYRANLDVPGFDQGSVTGTAGYAHSFANKDVVSLSGQVQQFWLGGDSYRQAYGAIAQYTHLLPKGASLSLSGQYYRFDYDRDPLRDADRYAASVSYADRNLIATITGGKEETVRQIGDVNSNSFFGASVGTEQALGDGLAFVGGIAFDLRRYDQVDVLFLTTRKDERLDINAGFKQLVMRNLYLTANASYARNWSKIALYDHDRWTVSGGLRFEF